MAVVDMSLSDKIIINREYNLPNDGDIPTKDVKEAVKELKEALPTVFHSRVIQEIFGEKLIDKPKFFTMRTDTRT